tara:strand:- start:21698 stop:22117 length:420 start_codon:yes stop_codon:yes gene_type:complete
MKKINFTVEDTSTFNVLNPMTGEDICDDSGLACSITIYGIMTENYDVAKNKILNRRINRPGKKNSIEKELRDGIELMVANIKSLNNFGHIQINGIDVTMENIKDVLSNPSAKWFKDQIDTAIGDDRAFLSQGLQKPMKD